MNKELFAKVKELTSSGLAFMEGKQAGKLEDGARYIIKDYGYLDGDNGEYVVLADEVNFYYGGSVVTTSFKKLDDHLTESEIADILKDGLEIKVSKLLSKNKRSYTKCEFFPD